MIILTISFSVLLESIENLNLKEELLVLFSSISVRHVTITLSPVSGTDTSRMMGFSGEN